MFGLRVRPSISSFFFFLWVLPSLSIDFGTRARVCMCVLCRCAAQHNTCLSFVLLRYHFFFFFVQVLLPLNEPTFGTTKKSQIQTYLEQNDGPGLQHMVSSCYDTV